MSPNIWLKEDEVATLLNVSTRTVRRNKILYKTDNVPSQKNRGKTVCLYSLKSLPPQAIKKYIEESFPEIASLIKSDPVPFDKAKPSFKITITIEG